MNLLGGEPTEPQKHPTPLSLGGPEQKAAIDVLNEICALVITTPDGKIIQVNDRLLKISGFSRGELIGKKMKILSSGKHSGDHWKNFWDTLLGGSTWEGDVYNRRKDGAIFCFHAVVTPVIEGGIICGYLAAYHDITQQDTLAGQLNAHTLGLPGTTELQANLDKSIGKVLVLFRLNEIDTINRKFGSSIGNDAVITLYRALSKCNGCGTLYKFQGSEFALVFSDVSAYEKASLNIVNTLRNLELACMIHDNTISIPLSLDAACVVTGGLAGVNALGQGESLLTRGNCGLDGLTRLHYSHDLPLDPYGENAIRNAFVNQIFQEDRIYPAGQLIFCYSEEIQAYVCEKVEILLRIQGYNRNIDGIISDISVFSGHRRKMTRTIMEKTFLLMQQIGVEFSHNIGTPEIRDSDFIRYLTELAKIYSIQPGRIVFEILEDVDSHDGKSIETFVNALKELGCKTSVDDLGTDQSGINRMKIGTNYVKVDRSFIQGIHEKPDSQEFVGHIVVLAHSKGMKVVAEGIETNEELVTLRALGVDFFQGYYLHKPEPLDAIVKNEKHKLTLVK